MATKKKTKKATKTTGEPPLRRSCGAMAVHMALLEKYPQYRKVSLDGRPIVRVEIERGTEWSGATSSP